MSKLLQIALEIIRRLDKSSSIILGLNSTTPTELPEWQRFAAAEINNDREEEISVFGDIAFPSGTVSGISPRPMRRSPHDRNYQRWLMPCCDEAEEPSVSFETCDYDYIL